jgi:hypothetical protein
MEPLLLQAFQTQLDLQFEFVLRAAVDLNAALVNGDPRATFYAIQNLLNAAANASKVLWGSGGKLAAVRLPLRESIGVTDESPLHIPSMRNNFEHLDERIDVWWAKTKTRGNIDLNIMPRGMIHRAVADPLDEFRNFDPITTDLTFWGQEFNLRALVEEVNRLSLKLKEVMLASRSQRPAPTPPAAASDTTQDAATEEPDARNVQNG